MKRAILRKPGGAGDGPILPGTQIYFWVPKKLSKRYTRGGLWRGPATILVREGQRRYFASWRGRALLLAQENIRLATKEELALNEPAKQDAEEIGHLLRDPLRDNAYRDQTHVPPPPQRRVEKRASQGDLTQRKRARVMLRGTKSVRKLLQDVAGRPEQVRKRRRKQEAPAPAAPKSEVAAPPRTQQPVEERAPSLSYEPSEAIDDRVMPEEELPEPAAAEQEEPAAPEDEERPKPEEIPVDVPISLKKGKMASRSWMPNTGQRG